MTERVGVSMTPKEDTVSSIEAHYTRGHLIRAITEGLAGLGRTPQSVTPDELSPVDEFHVGGRQATEELMQQLHLAKDVRVLDVGSGDGLLVPSIADADFRLVARYELELAAARKRHVAVRNRKLGRAF